MSRITRFLIDRAWAILGLSVLLTIIGGYYSVQLYSNLRTDLEELLPTSARSVIDMNEVTSRLESIDNLAVLIFSQDTKASRRFVLDLVERLKPVPKDTIASVEYNIKSELEFFKRRRALYMETPDLVRVREYIRDRLEYEKTLYNPLTIFSEANIPEPRLDFKGIKQKYDSKVSSYSRFPDGFYATPDETKRVVLVYKPGAGSGDSNQRLKNAVASAIEALNPKSYAPDLEIHYAGGVQNTIEEQGALVADLELSTVIVTVVVGIAMYVFFRAGRAVAALLACLLMGTIWTFGISYFAVGYLNANSAFLGSIILGNGINFPIIFLARYLEERRDGHEHDHSLDQAITHTATSTWTAALAAGLAYGSLSLTSFRGFKQFGIIGLIGMVLCWLAAFTALPAMLTILERWKSLRPTKQPPRSYIAEGIARFVPRHARVLTLLTIVATVASGLMAFRYKKTILETDLSKLRNKVSMEKGSGFYAQYVDEIFQRYLSPLVALPKDRQHALEIAEKLKNLKAQEGDKSLIAAVQTLDDFIPKDQATKISIIRQIEAELPPSIRGRLPPRERELADEFLTPESGKQIGMMDLPQLVLSKFTEKDGSIGKLVLIEPPLDSASADGDDLIAFVRELRDTADSVAPGTPVAGGLPISSDLIESISRDGPKATLFALISVVLLVVILFREPRIFGPVILALGLGVVWLGGLILAFWFKINFLNFIALPITFGIGVDYGVNIFQRYREEGPGSIVKVIRDTGGAVLLCSFTTMAGWGSLLIADNQAFVSFGQLAVFGELTCIAAAMISLPAILLCLAKPENIPAVAAVAGSAKPNPARSSHPEKGASP